MDFEIPYTEEQQRFRQEVRDWIKRNVPEDLKDPLDDRAHAIERDKRWQEIHKKLGAKGWLYPTYPRAYGGGGLTGDHETILGEEFQRAGVPNNFTSPNTIPGIMVWGTEEQKQRILKPIFTGQKTCWHKITEPKGGVDLADYHGRAVRDGDDWLLTGENCFISGRGIPSFLGGLMCTDTDAPRHRNLGYFFIPVPAWDPVTGETGTPGLTIKEQDLLHGHNQHVVIMDNARVSGESLIGGDHQGWQVENSNLEQEHGGRGRAFVGDEPVEHMMAYAKETKVDGKSLGSDPAIQQIAMDAYIESHVSALLEKRTYWMYQNRFHIQHEGNVSNVFDRMSCLRNAGRVRAVMGMNVFLDPQDPRAPFGGAPSNDQRHKAGQRHPGGTNNIAKVILARRIGISRTRERAAPTPSTIASGTSQGV